MKVLVLFCLLLLSCYISKCQRVAPGVPPQQYQPQYQQQHYQKPNPSQYQQQTHQQQQVPLQQPAGQQNLHHGHGKPHQQHVLNTANIEHEKEHIAEHLDIPIDPKDMTTEQLQFHYFQMHDADGNNMLDGCELAKSLIHWHEQGSRSGGNNIEERIFKDEELVTLIDPILNMDDTNSDGYIDYPEFIQAQRKAATTGATPKH